MLNGSNSLATATTTRTFQGIQSQLVSVNSTITSTSFMANPHLYLGDLMSAMYANGASVDTEEWAVVAGRTWARAISDLNDTKVQDSNTHELFQRRIRTYSGPLNQARVFVSRVLPATEVLIIPKDRLRVLPLQGRSFSYADMAPAGDNRKGLITGEYTLELFHESAMARAHA